MSNNEQQEYDDLINVDTDKYFGRDIYNEKGYATRLDYLRTLAEDYGVDESAVIATAEMLGPTEDFDGLIAMIEDFGYMISTVDTDGFMQEAMK